MKTLYKLFKNYSLKGGIIYLKLKLQISNTISIPKVEHKILIRKNTSDIPTFFQIFANQEYDKIPIKFEPKTIIDLGGNIGLAAIFFANKFSDSRIISVEPEDSNFEIMIKNTCKYNNIYPLKNAISNKDNLNIKIEDNGYGKWGFMTKIIDSSSESETKTISIKSIMKKFSISNIDILKIDIEGAEKELFESDYESWLPLTKCIIIELHDRMRTGSSRNFFRAISKYNFSFRIRGENVVMINQDIKQ